MMLGSFAHFGANGFKQHRQSQEEIEQLAIDRKINQALIEAQVRLELAPKKYRVAHEKYLAAIKSGQKAVKPVVHERSAATVPATEAKQVQKAA